MLVQKLDGAPDEHRIILALAKECVRRAFIEKAFMLLAQLIKLFTQAV